MPTCIRQNDQIEITLGERRMVEVEFYTCDGDGFIIRNPVYRIKRGDFVEDEGTPEVNGRTLYVLLEPASTGRFTLECEIEVACEIIIRRIPIYVRK